MSNGELFRAGRKALGLGTPRMARALCLSGGNVLRAWENNSRAVPGPAWTALYLLLEDRGERELADQVRRGPMAKAWPVVRPAVIRVA